MATSTTGPSTGSSTPNVPAAPPAATSVVFWDANPELYQQFQKPGPWLTGKLAKQDVPGLMKVKVGGAKRKVDAQTPPAKGGAKIVVKGWTPSPVTITIVLWTPSQFEAWQQLKPLLRVDTDKKDPVAILHPVAEESNIYNILIDCVSGMEDGSLAGTKEVTITATDSGAPKDTGTGTAKNGKGGGMTKDQWFILYIGYVNPIQAMSGMWLPWSTWITNQGQPQFASPAPAGYAAIQPPSGP